MPLQNSTNGTTVLYKSPITGTFGSSQVPSYNGSAFIPGSGGGGTWGSITGTLSNQTDLQTALNGKQATITTGSTSQYFRGNLSLSSFSTDALAVALTGLTSTSGTIASTDNILAAFGKTLKGLADVNIRVDNLTTPNTGFFNGGENATQNRTLGNTTNYNVAIITNNTERLSITGGGVANVWSSSRYAVPNGYMAAGSLTIGNLSSAYGNGNNWNSSTAQLLLECTTNTEIATYINGVGVYSIAMAEINASNPTRRITIGRDMNWGRTHMLRNASNSFVQAATSFSLSNFSSYLNADDRPTIAIGGNYPHLFFVSQGNAAASNAGAMKFVCVGSDGTHRHLNAGQRNDGKYYAIAYYEGTDYNPHNNLSSSTGTIQYVMPGYSASSNLSTGLGMGINIDAASTLYNLHIRGTDSTNGTIGWGLNDGCRTENKIDANASDRIGKQSGFFRANTTPTNFFSGANTNVLLIDCRLDTASFGMQIAGNYDADDIWTRKIGRTWYKMLTTLNGWSRLGNDLSTNSSDNKIGSTSAHDVIYIANNIEVFRLPSGTPRSIQVDASTYGTASNPNYAFRGNFGENNGMYYSASGKLSFSTNSTERLQIDNGNNINAYLPINLAGSTQEIRMGGTKVLGTRGSAISTISNTATGTEIATAVNAIISRMQGHGLIS